MGNKVELEVNAKVEQAKAALGSLDKDLQKVADGATRLGADFRQTNAIVDDWIGTLRASTPQNAKYAQSVASVTKEFQDGKISAQQAADKLEILQKEMGQTDKAADKLAASMKEAGSGFKMAGLSLTDIKSGFDMVVNAARPVVDAVKEMVTGWSEYAEQIDKSSKLAGVSTEEMSRLVQAADDFRVSEDALKTAMAMALKNGFVPTIDNLANLSDKFLAIEDPSERAAMASKIFGRQWQEIAPLLLKGGDAIRAGTDAINDNLIVTTDAVKANTEYIKAMDDLDDAWTGIKNTAAKELIPALTNVLRALNGEEVNRTVNGYERMFKSAEENLAIFKDVGKDTNEMLYGMKDAASGAAGGLGELGDAAEIEQGKIDRLNVLMGDYTEKLLFNQAAASLDAEASLRLAKSMGLIEPETEAVMGALDEITAKYDLNKDGAIDAGEATGDYVKEVSDLKDVIALLESKKVTVTTEHIDEYYSVIYEGAPPPNRNEQTYGGEQEYAAGGQFVIPPGYENHTWPVGPGRWAQSGETVTISPKGAGSAPTGGGVVYQVSWNGDYQALANELDRREQLRRLMA